jgi:uncharacterized protein (TIGR00369 family)
MIDRREGHPRSAAIDRSATASRRRPVERAFAASLVVFPLCCLVARSAIASGGESRGGRDGRERGGAATANVATESRASSGDQAMGERTGPFWDAVAGRAPIPRAAASLGFELIDADVEKGTIEVAFTATEAFTTPLGDVLGGFLSAMLYDTVGPAVLATLKPDRFISTIEQKTSFLRPAKPGRLIGRGHIVHRDGDLAFVEASLANADGAVVATATATIRVITMPAQKS